MFLEITLNFRGIWKVYILDTNFCWSFQTSAGHPYIKTHVQRLTLSLNRWSRDRKFSRAKPL